MQVYRLSRKKYSGTLSGKGAAKAGNRWNSKGTEMIYAAESRALAMAEVVVHLSLHNLPKDFVMMEILIPDSLPVDEIRPQNLPEGWNSHPPIVETQRLGDHFVNNNKSVVLRVPSAVVPGDYNYLINPHHSGFSKISIEQIEDFPWDKRLF